jgi:23S rRNA (uracil1939-C5)-methyltransferase
MMLDLQIETLTPGGRGLGRHGGMAVFVPGTAPGDRVRCRVVRSRSRYAEAELVEVLVAAPERRQPPCPVFGRCGGCQWQHLPYALQADWKERLFGEQLLRSGVGTPAALRPIVAAPAEWDYRNRVQFKCRQTPQGFVAGFYRQGSHYVVDVPCCRLAMPAIQAGYAGLRELLPTAPNPAVLPQVDLAASDNGRITVLLHALTGEGAALGDWLRAAACQGDFAAALQVGRKSSIRSLHGDTALATSVDEPPLQLRIGAGGFAQVNPVQNRRLVAAVVAAAELTGSERLLDLYCGVGNFTLALARRAAAVVGVESFPPAIADARMNAEYNGIGNATFHAEPAEGAALRHGRFDQVLLDPPRTGAYPVMRDLLSLRPRRILYVSCDPATLVRDLQPLVHNGYRVVSAQPFDLFPQTFHIESLTVLTRED